MVQESHSFILVSNDLQELQSVTRRLASSHDDVRGLHEISEWQSVSQHDYWGYRRYRHSGVVNREAAGMTDVTPSAEALIFSVDFKQRKGVLRLLASDDATAEKMNAAITRWKAALPPLKLSSAGAWEAMIPFAGDQETGQRLFEVSGLFGFGLYL